MREHDACSAELAIAFDTATQAVVGPWYEATVQNGQLRHAEMGAAMSGDRFAPEGPGAVVMALARAKSVDEDAARWFAELLSCLTTPEELFKRPGVLARVIEIDTRADQPPTPGPKPQRAPRPRRLPSRLAVPSRVVIQPCHAHAAAVRLVHPHPTRRGGLVDPGRR